MKQNPAPITQVEFRSSGFKTRSASKVREYTGKKPRAQRNARLWVNIWSQGYRQGKQYRYQP